MLVNRYQKGSPITREVIEETVGLPVGAVVGNDFSGLSRAVNRGGAPLGGGAPVARWSATWRRSRR